MSLRVLIVDDEPHVLAAIQRLMRSRRAEFLVSAAVGGAAALATLEQSEPYDVIISDMRMAAMDGADLLARVRERHPGVVRLILSGQTELDVAFRVVSLAHQFLSKPCSADQLLAVLGRVSAALTGIADLALRANVVSLGALPCAADASAKLERLLGSQDPATGAIAEIVAGDVAMSAKALQLVNSAFFGKARSVRDPREAVALLGPALIRDLAQKTGAFAALGGAEGPVDPRRSFAERVGQLTRLATEGRELATSQTDRDLGQSLLGLWGIAA